MFQLVFIYFIEKNVSLPHCMHGGTQTQIQLYKFLPPPEPVG